MTEEQIALARRAVACKGFRWMPGMAGTDALGVPFRCALTRHSGGIMVVAGMAVMVAHPDALAHMFPDLTDPATLGCLLALVRDAYGDPSLYVRLSDTTRSDGVRAWEALGWLDPSRSPDGRGGSWRGWGYASEAEALVAALEAVR